MSLNKYALDFDAAIAFCRQQLSSGLTLSKKLLEKIDFKKGNFFTLLPDEAKIERLDKFSQGGILPSLDKDENSKYSNFWPRPNSDHAVIDFIYRYLTEDELHTTVLEHIIAKPTDRSLKLEGVDLVIYQDEVYYFLESNITNETVEKAVSKVKEVWHFVAVLSHGIQYHVAKFSDGDFDIICEGIDYLVFGAYDGEGYIFWEKK